MQTCAIGSYPKRHAIKPCALQPMLQLCIALVGCALLQVADPQVQFYEYLCICNTPQIRKEGLLMDFLHTIHISTDVPPPCLQ